MDATNLIAYLPFDTSTTLDLCGGAWTATGNPTIQDGVLNLDGSSYLERDGGITLGGQDFTIRGWFNMASAAASYAMLLEATTSRGSNNRMEISRYGTGNEMTVWANELWGIKPNFNVPVDRRFYFEMDYIHSVTTVKIFVDGVQVANVNKNLAAKNLVAENLAVKKFCRCEKILP